ncbi:MAG TPA: CinA family nicotinamide mononucleotide deamidase-related protein [Pirellulales bacterium]|nr:CinA family nicotinamide mononucleotide deamidase-related protein [Pirellulales bacterium]
MAGILADVDIEGHVAIVCGCCINSLGANYGMIAEIVSIGDELTSGQRLDTNSQWLSQRLGEIGIPVVYHSTVADDLEANVKVFRQAVERADLVLATGGLGPTADDLTREALAKMAGVELMLMPAALDHIHGLFARRQREMPQGNVVQAMFPAGSRMIHNPHGTAPGIDLDVPPPLGRPSRVLALPGVPAEMREMWQGTVAGLLGGLAGDRVILHRRIKCFGVGESDLEQMLPDLIRRGRTPSVGITVSEATITLRITAAGATAEQCRAAMEPTIATIRACLGSLVYGEEDDELEHAVLRLLAAHGQTLATAECGTAGLMAQWLGDVSEPAGCHLAGLTLPSPELLIKLLGVRAELFAHHSPVSGEVAALMASACRERVNADYGLAVSAFPPFDPDAAEPERVFFAVATRRGVVIRSSAFAGHPAILKARAAKQALNVLRLELLEEG